MTTSKRLTIFEGCDSGGKSTAAQAYARTTGALYVHFGPLPQVHAGLARMYVEAILPAALGYQDVVLDRAWPSERIYGDAFRGGANRLGATSAVAGATVRMLERLALRCGAVVVFCDPGWEAICKTFSARRAQEMLQDREQLRQVWKAYGRRETGLPHLTYDYHLDASEDLDSRVEALRAPCHPLSLASAGAWDAPTLLVGEVFGEVKDQDSLLQWPFASFGGSGCSRWLTEQLAEAGIPERELCWINADQDLALLTQPQENFHGGPFRIIALGAKAADALSALKVLHLTVDHPQAWKRFHHQERYPLLDLLTEKP